MTDKEVIEWLNSPVGRKWSRTTHHPIPAVLMEIKDDNPADLTIFENEWEPSDLLWYQRRC